MTHARHLLALAAAAALPALAQQPQAPAAAPQAPRPAAAPARQAAARPPARPGPAPPPAPARHTPQANALNSPEAVAIQATPEQVQSSKEAVRAAVRAHDAEVRRCYEARLAAAPGLAGKLTMRWVVLRGGASSGAEVVAEGTTLEDAEVHRCLAAAISGWRIPGLTGTSSKVTYTWFLRPPAAQE